MNFKFKILALASILFLSSSQFSAFANALKGAEYRTKDAFTYGRFEVRMKSAGREGMLSSFLPILMEPNQIPGQLISGMKLILKLWEDMMITYSSILLH